MDKKPMGKIDLTPTWSEKLPSLIALVATSATLQGREVGRNELKRMASIADQYVADQNPAADLDYQLCNSEFPDFRGVEEFKTIMRMVGPKAQDVSWRSDDFPTIDVDNLEITVVDRDIKTGLPFVGIIYLARFISLETRKAYGEATTLLTLQDLLEYIQTNAALMSDDERAKHDERRIS